MFWNFKKRLLKNVILYLLYIFGTVIFLPFVITFYLFGKGGLAEEGALNFEVPFTYSPEYSESKNFGEKSLIKEENPDMESYIIGVVAAEMPVSFEKEALKAQAVAARTYAYRQIGNSLEIVPENIGQAYISVDEMKKRWGENFDQNYEKVSAAVYETKNEIMVFGGEPILAVFHSTSGGVTESSENVWSEKLSYLQSVDSHYDENAPDFLVNSEFLESDFRERFLKQGCFFSQNIKDDISILERSDAGYVKKIEIGGKIFKGAVVRQILALRSTNFTVSFDNSKIIFTTKGYGHGAGMSQYGAEFFAKSGKNYKEILLHYYYGVEFISIKG